MRPLGFRFCRVQSNGDTSNHLSPLGNRVFGNTAMPCLRGQTASVDRGRPHASARAGSAGRAPHPLFPLREMRPSASRRRVRPPVCLGRQRPFFFSEWNLRPMTAPITETAATRTITNVVVSRGAIVRPSFRLVARNMRFCQAIALSSLLQIETRPHKAIERVTLISPFCTVELFGATRSNGVRRGNTTRLLGKLPLQPRC